MADKDAAEALMQWTQSEMLQAAAAWNRGTLDSSSDKRLWADLTARTQASWLNYYHQQRAKGMVWADPSGNLDHARSGLTPPQAAKQYDVVNHPAHYTFGKIEVIDVLDDWRLNYNRSCVIKYVARAGRKDASKELEDLEKAKWYLDREISKLSTKT